MHTFATPSPNDAPARIVSQFTVVLMIVNRESNRTRSNERKVRVQIQRTLAYIGVGVPSGLQSSPKSQVLNIAYN